jgi:RimJ/RimL family protein N-acetyltransferase
VLSISLARAQRGRGHGRRVLRLAAGEVFAGSDAARISAYVKEDNPASRRAFLAAGFDLLGAAECRGHRAEHFVLRRAA